MDKKSYSTTVLKKGNGIVVSVSNERVTTFAGVVRNEVFFVDGINGNIKELLVTAVNNRTRERNYFKKYVELLEGTISDDEFDKAIEDNEDDYVISEDKEPTLEDVQCVLEMAPELKDVDSVEDLASLFSFKPNSMQKCLMK
ncbi:MAG: hypothetical protein IJ355_02690 [Prevotella sp.]|nr:hypothetical protein [Prevotella sp.]